ncbi:syntaxin of plants 73 [Actinidia rufa]|uniref:Syntaxin of plants 73 n=1 Tax=Actinidia rufa TaxID=165716 RepID=A0A7J0H2A9_9ERIC|nr:syntaxin of plants 73 [Actinidia rufa]
MTVNSLITRVDAICKKYEKYDIDKKKETHVTGDDAFARLYAAFESNIDQALEKSEAAATERNRASAVAMNAEIRRIKARLMEEIPKLQRLAVKKVKGLSKEELEAQTDLVSALKERIEAIPDGSTSGAKQTGGWATSASGTGIKFDSTSGSFDFVQDEGLDVIAEGLDTLKNMARDLNEELDRQVPLMDEIDDKVDRATSDLKSTNVRLKHTVTQLRSSRNFCIDIILLCIILGIAAAYLYK